MNKWMPKVVIFPNSNVWTKPLRQSPRWTLVFSRRLLRFTHCAASLHYLKNTAIHFNTLYQLWYMCRRNDYRPVWKKVTWHYELHVNAFNQSEKPKTSIKCDWSPDSDTIRTIILRSTMVLVRKLVSNRAKANILLCLLKTFLKHRPQLYSRKLALFEASQDPLSP